MKPTDLFWRWLSRLDARRAVLLAVALAIAAGLVTALRDYGLGEMARPYFHQGEIGAAPAAGRRPSPAPVKPEIARKKGRIARNPFASPLLDELLAKAQAEREAARRAEAERLAREEAERKAREAAEAERLAREREAAARQASEPPPPAPPPDVSWTYQGLFERTDGKVLALVENATAKASAFLAVGNSVENAQVKTITPLRLILQSPEGRELILECGQPRTLKEAAHAHPAH
jgi:hypothetical protein